MFRALLLTKDGDRLAAEIRDADPQDLPPGEVELDVAYSSLNYKDGLAVTGKGKIVRGAFPFVPGIDLAGTVRTSSDPSFQVGDAVILTGYGTGEDRWGGFAQRARARAEHLVPLPAGLTLHRAMALGTAGFTAMLAVMALEDHGHTPDGGLVLVTGATGGVGSVAVALLRRLGFEVAAATGKAAEHAYLGRLGAQHIVDRAELAGPPARPLDAGRWQAAVDNVGGDTLATVLTQLKTHGSVAACGNAGGFHLNTSVFPFILRGNNLLGIDSNYCPMPRRRAAWARLAALLDAPFFEEVTHTIALGDVPAYADRITAASLRGRVVVDVNA